MCILILSKYIMVNVLGCLVFELSIFSAF